ncbi:hypothetical protein MLD38_038673 [Melastoma candidum]|uniref:Uncharacterized protein n=1 Tax=Melastoma candidum TaxID=119954 RepID=A0ACB9L146_9MYRT|nr:hypothetical protein MLD38_038673 [Melastoma candidum]
MGKASKWLISFLSGKKEREKRSDGTPLHPEGTLVPAVVFPLTTTKVKRGWSFGKSAGKVILRAHKPSRSLDSLESGQLVGRAKVVESPVPLVVRGRDTTVAVAPKDERKAAATKIQAAFRSHLARKALSALKSLVKIQALVRGFLVRKQTTAAMRSMHALMNIQVRARAHRVLMADHLNIALSEHLLAHRKSSVELDHRKLYKERLETLLDETSQVSKSKSSHFINPKVERIGQSITTYYSGDLSFVKQEQKYKEFIYSSAQSTPKNFSSVSKGKSSRAPASSTKQKTDYVTMESQDYPTTPRYMVNTESSRAKTRSQSEPKQRPDTSFKHKSKQNKSIDGTDISVDTEMQEFISRAKFVTPESREPWVLKLYRSRKALEKSEHDSTSTTTTQSNHSRSIFGYEPHLTMY